ncbi:MAG: DNA adenine methylase [Rhodobacteraceae bacterium]|nr:DNA adenine methylase [Paracoccaceae bacterium]
MGASAKSALAAVDALPPPHPIRRRVAPEPPVVPPIAAKEAKARAKPFVKWVGGKRSILKTLVVAAPKNYAHYHEPFAGGGALFFELQPSPASLSDINPHLMTAYRAVRDTIDALVKALQRHARAHCKDHYLHARACLSREGDPTARAALLIYLNKTGYNGLYRVNRAGHYNVPMGDYTSPSILDEENLRRASQALQGVQIHTRSFSQIEPAKGDFFYLDPPYYKTYDQYSHDRFDAQAHEDLAKFCRRIDSKGGAFMLSNSDTDFVRRLYKGFGIREVMAARHVSCKAGQRGAHRELLIRNYD